MNVQRILANPRFRSDFVIVRTTVAMARGRVVSRTPARIPASGVVYPMGQAAMIRTDAIERQSRSIGIVTATRLSQGDASLNQPADQVDYAGHMYQIYKVDDYSRWGFWAGEATMIDPGARPDG